MPKPRLIQPHIDTALSSEPKNSDELTSKTIIIISRSSLKTFKRLPHPSTYIPIYGSDIVTRQVVSNFVKFHASPFKGRGIFPRADPRPDSQPLILCALSLSLTPQRSLSYPYRCIPIDCHRKIHLPVIVPKHPF